MNNNPYSPHEHLKTWQATNKKTGQKETVQHYPTEWRLYELVKDHPDINFVSEILHLNQENNFVVVQVSAFVGPDYITSPIKKQSISQGFLSEIDKVESKAQSRCARLLGYGTAHALASAPKKPEIDPSLKDKINLLFDKAISLELAEKGHKSDFIRLIAETVDETIASPEDITIEHLELFESFMASKEVQ